MLTYNAWFDEGVACAARMAAISGIIAAEEPDAVCLQEVTPRMEQMLRGAPWWATYAVSPASITAVYGTLLATRRHGGTGSSAAGGGFTRTLFAGSRQGRDVTCAVVGACARRGAALLRA